MKSKSLTLATISIIALLILGFVQSNQSKFYYAYDEKVYINESENKLIVRFKNSKKKDKIKISTSEDFKDKLLQWKDDSTYVVTLSNESEKLVFKNKLKSQIDVKSCNEIYSIDTGLELGVTDEFLVKFKANISQKEIEKLHQIYNVEIIKTTKIYQLLKVDINLSALEIANAYQESGLVRFSQPNFISDIELHQALPNDTYFANQFSLHNTGQVFADGHSGTIDADIDAPEAWGITTGNNGIIIAVLDEGVTSNHPDLPNTRQVRLNGSNFADGDPNNPSPTGNSNHGNGCAGIIAATQNNNEGISGIAPNCTIMPIRIFNANGTGITPQRLADAIEFAVDNGADVISNSWGYNSTNPNLQPVIRDAIIYATTQGRNNLGCVVVFSAGNTANHVQGNNGNVNFPSNVNVNGVLTVGASDRFDLQANYSPSEDTNSTNNQIIDLVAPSHRAYSCQIATETFEAFTIDIPNNAGYNPVSNTDCGNLPVVNSILPNTGTNHLSYTGRFGGTSYSCPQVSGVAALVLSVNSSLTQQDVFNIITSTADEVGGYIYDAQGKSSELGNGRLNAFAAVQAAVLPPSIAGSPMVCSSTTSTYTLTNAVGSVSWQVSNNLQIISSSSTNITVSPIGIRTSGSGFVKAIMSGTTVQKDFWVGKPSFPQLTTSSGVPYDEFNLPAGCANGVTYWVFKTSNPLDRVTQFQFSVQGGNVITKNASNGLATITAQELGMIEGMTLDVTVRPVNSCGSNFLVPKFKLYRPTDCECGIGINCNLNRVAAPNDRYNLYPNPTSGFINIVPVSSDSGTTSKSKIIATLYDMLGEKRKSVVINNNETLMDVQDLKAGMYIMRIQIDGEIETHLIVIN